MISVLCCWYNCLVCDIQFLQEEIYHFIDPITECPKCKGQIEMQLMPALKIDR